MKIFIKWMVFIALTGILMVCKQEKINDSVIRGVKFYPEHSNCPDAASCARSIHDAGFNTVFMPVREKDLQDSTAFDIHAFRAELKKSDIRFTAVVQVFYDPERWDKHPEWRAMDQDLDDTPESWQTMISPACEDFRNLKLEHINRIIHELNPDMLALDFIRYPALWEAIHVDSLHKVTRRYDYNPLSINKLNKLSNAGFTSDTLIHQTPPQAWISFKTEQITSFVKEVKNLAGDIPLILHILPWLEKEQALFLKSIAGQDVQALSEYADILSPMLYTMVPGLTTGRIEKMESDFRNRHPDVSLLPSFLIPDDSPVSLSDYDLSKGYLLFHWGKVERERDLCKKLNHAL
jgi:hypothetical protein